MIHDAIMDRLQKHLERKLISEIPVNDPARVGIVLRGPLQGNPDPDEARISVTLYENDPDRVIGETGATSIMEKWEDKILEVECGGAITWQRRFTVKARCLLVRTREGLAEAQQIASTVRSRIEEAILTCDFSGINHNGEFVSRGAIASSMSGEMFQAGGPPDSYDYHIKVRFDVWTTKGVVP